MKLSYLSFSHLSFSAKSLYSQYFTLYLLLFGFPDQQSDATPATNAIEELSENDSQISSNKEVNKQVLEL